MEVSKTVTHVVTPTLDRMSAIHGTSQVLGEFLEWLQADGVVFARRHDHDDCGRSSVGWTCGLTSGRLIPDSPNIERLLARFFDIDLDAADREKRALLEYVREGR